MNFPDQITAIVRTLVLNTESRVRAGWRLFTCLLLCTIGWAIGGFVYSSVFDGLLSDIAQVVVFVAVVVISVSIMNKYFDSRRLSDFGFHIDREWFLDLLVGLFIGASIPAAVLAVSLGARRASVEGIGPVDQSTIVFLLIGVFITSGMSIGEELLFRGYILKNLVAGFQSMTPNIAIMAAWGVSAALFALYHGNPITFEGLYFWIVGLVLALPVILRGELAMALGIHMMNNYWVLYILGVTEVPGVSVGSPLLTVEHGSAGFWFGPGGAVEIISVLSAVPLILAWVWWREEGMSSIWPLTSTRNTTDETE